MTLVDILAHPCIIAASCGELNPKRLKPPRRYYRINHLEIAFPIHFFARGELGNISLIRKKLKSAPKSTTSNYLLALLKAIEELTNIELYINAEAEELKLNFELESHFKVESQLGLGPSAFDSEEAWADSRQSQFDLDDNLIRDCFSKLDDQLSWLALFTPSEGIRFLDPILSDSIHKELDGPVFERIKKMSGNRPTLIEMVSLRHTRRNIHPKVLKYLVDMSCHIDLGDMSNHFIQLFWHSRFEIDGIAEANELLEALSKSNYSSRLNSVVLAACISVEGMDVNHLLGFWLKHCPDCRIPRYLLGDIFIEKLLDLDEPDAIKMATEVWISSTHRRKDAEVGAKLAKEYFKVLCLKRELTDSDLSRLFALEVHTRELDLWSDDQTLKVLESSTFLLEEFPERLMNLVNRHLS